MTLFRTFVRTARVTQLASAALLAATACSRTKDRPARPPVTVAVAPARRAAVPYTLEANGVVTPVQTAAVASQVDGIVVDVDFQEGQEVKQGQPLFRIDPRPYKNAYEQALATLSRDSATAANAAAQEQRYAKLIELRYVTKEEGDQLSATSKATEATVRADRAMVATAKFNLDNTTIRAPISGKTGSLLVRVGNLVHANGIAPLVVINQVRPILVRFAVPAAQLPMVLQYGVHGGLPVTAVPGGSTATTPLTDTSVGPPIDAPAQLTPSVATQQGGASDPPVPGGSKGPGRPAAAQGELTFIDNAVDTTTGTVTLKASFPNADGSLWAGQFAATSMRLFVEQNALVVPAQAVITGQKGTFVYVVDSSLTARQRPVSVERTAGQIAIIAGGLSDGERVVTDGQSRLTPGARVSMRTGADSVGGSGALPHKRRAKG